MIRWFAEAGGALEIFKSAQRSAAMVPRPQGKATRSVFVVRLPQGIELPSSCNKDSPQPEPCAGNSPNIRLAGERLGSAGIEIGWKVGGRM